jgi:hypothetical protein
MRLRRKMVFQSIRHKFEPISENKILNIFFVSNHRMRATVLGFYFSLENKFEGEGRRGEGSFCARAKQ